MKAPTYLEMRSALEDQCPPGYNAHTDRCADGWDHAEAVNVLGKALRAALDRLEKLLPTEELLK